MKDYKPLYDKAKELIEHYERVIYGISNRYGLNTEQPKAMKIKSELHHLESEIEKEEDNYIANDARMDN